MSVPTDSKSVSSKSLSKEQWLMEGLNASLYNLAKVILTINPNIVYCFKTRQYWDFDHINKLWVIMDTKFIMPLLESEYNNLRQKYIKLFNVSYKVEHCNIILATDKLLAKLSNDNFLKKLLPAIRGISSTPDFAITLNLERYLFPVSGSKPGVIDLRTGKWYEREAKHKFAWTSRCIIDTDITNIHSSEAKPLQFFKEVLGSDNKELLDYTLKVCGRSLLNDEKSRYFVVVNGDGNTGKNTLINLLIAVGQKWIFSNNYAITKKSSNLTGAVTGIEPNSNIIFANLTSNDHINPDIFRYLIEHNQPWLIGTNIKFNDPNSNIWNHADLIDCKLKFTIDCKQVSNYSQQLINDPEFMSGLLRLLIKGCTYYQAAKPMFIIEAIDKYKK